MIILILLTVLGALGIAATVREVRLDGYGRVRTDPRRLPTRD
ncbi:hypothetical protein [Microbacterium sp. NPDC096154]